MLVAFKRRKKEEGTKKGNQKLGVYSMLNDHAVEQDRIYKVLKTKTNDLFNISINWLDSYKNGGKRN